MLVLINYRLNYQSSKAPSKTHLSKNKALSSKVKPFLEIEISITDMSNIRYERSVYNIFVLFSVNYNFFYSFHPRFY